MEEVWFHQLLSRFFKNHVKKNLFSQLQSHMFDMCAEANHIHVLVKMASTWYCKIRLNHIAKLETEKVKAGQVVRRKLTKFIFKVNKKTEQLQCFVFFFPYTCLVCHCVVMFIFICVFLYAKIKCHVCLKLSLF